MIASSSSFSQCNCLAVLTRLSFWSDLETRFPEAQSLVGLLVFVIGMGLGGPTGYAINPARDLGPRIVHAILPIHGKGDSNWSYSWIPVLGPIAGGILGALAYKVFWM